MKKKTKAALGTVSVLTGMYAANKLIYKNTPKLESVLDGDKKYFNTKYGQIFYVKNGDGEPLIFVHGLASGVSSFAWRKNFEELAKHFTVYAIDLPGFGKSDKKAIIYKPYMYIDVLRAFAKDVVGEPAYVISSSQSSAYIFQLEYENPGMFKKIIAVCPTGIFELSSPPTLNQKLLSFSFRTPIIGTFAYNVMVSKPGIKYFLKRKTYYNKENASAYVINHYSKASKQNESLSKYAPASFLGGYLNYSVIGILPYINSPTLIIWGENAEMNTINNLKSFIDLNPKITYKIIDNSGYLPQEEHPSEFNDICKNFLLTSNDSKTDAEFA